MRYIITKILVALLVIYPTVAQSAITDGQFGPAQIFDVQYYWDGSDLYASSFIAPYAMSGQQPTPATGDYYQFFNSITDPGTYGLGLYDSDGVLKQTLHNTGTFSALGGGAIFYLGSGTYGTLISTAEGFNYGDNAVFTAMDTSVSAEDLQTYTFASNTPLNPGETAGPSTPTPIYISSITSTQTATKSSALSITTGNYVEITLTGSDNDISINQLTKGNYLDANITGDTNTLDLTQTSSTLARHYMELDLIGSNNDYTVLQSDAAKTAFITSDGDYNLFNITQQGGGNHYLNVETLGNDAVITILQEGIGNHSATIDLENGGGTWVFNLTQSGTTNQIYSMPHNLSDNTNVTGVCYTDTCSITIVQQ